MCRYEICIRPSVVLKNCLPIPIYYTRYRAVHWRLHTAHCTLHTPSGANTEFRTLEQGQIGCLEDMRHGQTMLR